MPSGLLETRPAVANPGIQKSRSNAQIRPNPFHLLHIRAHRFANRRDRVDERNLHRQKRIRSVLDQLRALRAGYNQRWRKLCPVEAGYRIRTASTSRRSKAHRFPATPPRTARIRTQDNRGNRKSVTAVPSTQEFRIRCYVERFRRRSIPKNDLPHPLARVPERCFSPPRSCTHRSAGNLACYRFHIRQDPASPLSVGGVPTATKIASLAFLPAECRSSENCNLCPRWRCNNSGRNFSRIGTWPVLQHAQPVSAGRLSTGMACMPPCRRKRGSRDQSHIARATRLRFACTSPVQKAFSGSSAVTAQAVIPASSRYSDEFLVWQVFSPPNPVIPTIREMPNHHANQ